MSGQSSFFMLDVFFMSLLPLEDDTFKCHKCIAPHITSSIKLNKIKGKQTGNEKIMRRRHKDNKMLMKLEN